MALYKGTQKINPIITVKNFNGQTKSVSLTNKNGQTFTADTNYDGISSITVTPNNKALSITPSKTSQSKTIPSGYSGYGTVSVSAVTSSIDSNITAGNIKSGVSILGVTGTYTGSGGGGGGSSFSSEYIDVLMHGFTFFEFVNDGDRAELTYVQDDLELEDVIMSIVVGAFGQKRTYAAAVSRYYPYYNTHIPCFIGDTNCDLLNEDSGGYASDITDIQATWNYSNGVNTFTVTISDENGGQTIINLDSSDLST